MGLWAVPGGGPDGQRHRRLEPIDELPRELVDLLEREVVTREELYDFWEHRDAVKRLVSDRDGSIPEDLDWRWEVAEQLLSPELIAALRPIVNDPRRWYNEHSALRLVMRDWEVLRLNAEKMLGHLTRTHRLPGEHLLDLELEELTLWHNSAHRL
jgi:hypothetical protein